jgi:hypothetical protein
MQISAYEKLRLSTPWVVDWLETYGLTVIKVAAEREAD